MTDIADLLKRWECAGGADGLVQRSELGYLLVRALRESERQLAELRLERDVLVQDRDEWRALHHAAESHRCALAEVVSGCAAAIAPLAERLGLSDKTGKCDQLGDCTAGESPYPCPEHNERVDAFVQRVADAARERMAELEAELAEAQRYGEPCCPKCQRADCRCAALGGKP